MIDANCFSSIPQATFCVISEVFGTITIGSIIMIILGAYAMHKAGLSFTVALPLAFMLGFSLFWITSADIFTKIMSLIMVVSLAIFAIALIRYFKR